MHPALHCHLLLYDIYLQGFFMDVIMIPAVFFMDVIMIPNALVFLLED